MDENTKNAIQQRLEVASNDAEVRLDGMQSQRVMSAECADTLTEREEREQRRFMFSPEYEQTLRTIFGDDIRHIHRTPRSLVIYTNSKGRLHDNGSSLTTYGMSAADSARLMVGIAVGVKGWNRIQFTGGREFVFAAMMAAVQENVTVVPRDDEQAAILQQVLAGRQGSGGLSITPQPIRSAAQHPTSAPQPIQAPAPPQPAFPLPSIFGDEIQRKLDARRRKEEEARLQQPKKGGLMAP